MTAAPMGMTGCPHSLHRRRGDAVIVRGAGRKWLVERIPPRLRTRARYWYRAARGRLDRELDLLSVVLRAHAVAVDVGAHDGIYSYFFIRHGLTVHAFEPLPGHAALLRAGLPGIVVHEVALGESPGAAALLVPYDGRRPAAGRAFIGEHSVHDNIAQRYTVGVVTLDALNLRDVAVLKIDVEGQELAVLRGARITVERELPVILLELEERHVGRDGWIRVTSWLAERGYSGYFLDTNGRVRPLESFDPAVLQRVVGGVPREPYINNFMFAARQSSANERLRARAGRC